MSLGKWPSGFRQRFTKPPKALDDFRGFESYFARFMSKPRTKKTKVKLEQYSSDGEYCLIIPNEMTDKLMWHEGTDVHVSIKDGKIIIESKENEQ